MPTVSSSKKPPEIWSRLSEREQFSLALATAQRRLAGLKRRYPDVVAAGAGYRMRRAVRHPEICLCVVVTKKWPRSKQAPRTPREGTLPPFLRVSLTRKGKRAYANIPIDVESRPSGRLAATVDLTDGIAVVGGDGEQLLSGSVCALVHDRVRPHDRYLLSCNHVLTGAGASPALEIDEHALTCSTDGAVIATLAQWAPLMMDGRFGTDAALAKVVDPQMTDVSVWERSVPGFGALDALPPQLFLMVRRRAKAANGRTAHRVGPIAATFTRVIDNLPFRYNRRTVGIRRAIQYKADTEDGDCGCAIMSGEGLVFGMHFFEDDNGFGYGVSVEDLFTNSPFGIDIDL